MIRVSLWKNVLLIGFYIKKKTFCSNLDFLFIEASDKLKPARNETVIECIKKLNELFKERPCYLKSVLSCITNYSPAVLKEALPHVAYYFTTGP